MEFINITKLEVSEVSWIKIYKYKLQEIEQDVYKRQGQEVKIWS